MAKEKSGVNTHTYLEKRALRERRGGGYSPVFLLANVAQLNLAGSVGSASSGASCSCCWRGAGSMIPTAEISSSNVGVSSRPSSIAGPPREIKKKFPKFSIVKLLPIIQIHFLKREIPDGRPQLPDLSGHVSLCNISLSKLQFVSLLQTHTVRLESEREGRELVLNVPLRQVASAGQKKEF